MTASRVRPADGSDVGVENAEGDAAGGLSDVVTPCAFCAGTGQVVVGVDTDTNPVGGLCGECDGTGRFR